jgi:hypothetical protein
LRERGKVIRFAEEKEGTMRFARVLAVLGLVAGGWACGMEIPRYFNGVEGIKCGSAPPPGYYLRSYNVWYHSTDLKDKNGTNVDVGFKLDVAASAERFIWVTDAPKKELGFDFGVYAIVPFEYVSMKMENMDLEDKRFGVGDVEICPAMLAWHFSRVDLTLAYEFFAPVGQVVGQMRRVTPVREIIFEMVDEYIATVSGLSTELERS